MEKRRRPSQRRRDIVSFFLFLSLAVALYWQSVNFFFPWCHNLPLTTVSWQSFLQVGDIHFLLPQLSYLVLCSAFLARFCTVGVVFILRELARLTGHLESVVILGPHGIQLETHRGFLTRLPWLTNRRFIASTHLHGVYINEGLRGWNVRFYLVAIKHTALTGSTFEVAYQVSDFKKPFALLLYSARFQNLLPDQSILQHIYQGIHEILLLSSPTITNR